MADDRRSSIMKTHHLVHFNLAIAREALDHPLMAAFAAQLEPVNQLARTSPGFVWTPEGEESGNAVAIFGSDRALPNLSVWRSLDDLRRFVYTGPHSAALAQKHEWFERPQGPAYVLWWTLAGHRPGLAEAKERLDHLAAHGPTSSAFDFKHAFEPPVD
jgi:hypothetical protein